MENIYFFCTKDLTLGFIQARQAIHSSSPNNVLYLVVFLVLRIKPKALCMISKHSALQLYLQSLYMGYL